MNDCDKSISGYLLYTLEGEVAPGSIATSTTIISKHAAFIGRLGLDELPKVVLLVSSTDAGDGGESSKGTGNGDEFHG